jgi:hypothetical protein
LPVTVLTDSNLWRVDFGGPTSGYTACSNLIAPFRFFNTSSDTEYVEAQNLEVPPFEVAPGASIDLEHIYVDGARNPLGTLRVTATDGQTTAYLTQSYFPDFECRATATLANDPSATSGDAVATTAILPFTASHSVSVLNQPGLWRIDLGTVGPVACTGQDTVNPSLTFNNTSNRTETIAGGPYATPFKVAPGAAADLGNSAWPNSSNPLGVLHIDAAGSQTDAYPTEGYFAGDECWGTATSDVVTP